MKDASCLPAPRSRSRACVMCSGKGHGKNRCPKLILYGAMPLPDGVLNVRQTLSNNLMDVDHFKTFTRDDFDNREIMKSFPKFRLPACIDYSQKIYHTRKSGKDKSLKQSMFRMHISIDWG